MFALTNNVNEKTKATRERLKKIKKCDNLKTILDEYTLSDIEKEIVTLHYCKKKPLNYIGDILGYSESRIKQLHREVLIKMSD